MSLEAYRSRRDFDRTAEPRGSGDTAKGAARFVVQKHDARRLHYDFRLEMDGVLKSWAVTRGPSLVPGDKRLAVHVEDHPLDYGDFEGTIPKGEYGGGTVIVWDRGDWTPVGDAAKGYAKGHLEFELAGEKLRGRWHLVRLARKPREKRDNWLLIKAEDEEARTPQEPDILEERPNSAKTGRRVEDVAGETPGWSSKTGPIIRTKTRDDAAWDPSLFPKARKEALPPFVEPALATLSAKPPSGAKWLHEVKFDGYRLQARIEAGRVRLLTRSGLDWTAKFGAALGAALAALPVEGALLDGEVVVEAASGASDFSLLQSDLSEKRSERFRYYVFDILHLDGFGLRAVPLVDRKALLGRIVPAGGTMVLLSETFEEDGGVLLRHACRLGLEGIVSKLRDAPYRSGRGKDWLKGKCVDRQEFVIVGYVPSSTSRKAVGSLVLGYHDGDRLVHAGRVGTGLTAAVAEDLFRRLDPIRTPATPVSGGLAADAAQKVRHVAPRLVVEVEFRGWTADRHLRHASYRGLRDDKPAAQIVREETGMTDARSATAATAVKLTHPDRLYWPETGVTKEGLADYYASVWDRMAPFILARPLALVRCPDGIAGHCFFQKHAWHGIHPGIRQVPDPLDKDAEPLVTIDDFDGLAGLVQAGALELHPWGATMADLERPDLIVVDLDPDDGVAWETIIAAAVEVRDRLEALGLASFVKTSGGKGLHVVAPLVPKADWDAVKAFARNLAGAMASDAPDRFVATATKSKRRGKIFVDYLRNGRGSTAVAPYSTRARPGAAVSMPLAWKELPDIAGPASFTVADSAGRIAGQADPWAAFRDAASPLPGFRKGHAKR